MAMIRYQRGVFGRTAERVCATPSRTDGFGPHSRIKRSNANGNVRVRQARWYRGGTAQNLKDKYLRGFWPSSSQE